MTYLRKVSLPRASSLASLIGDKEGLQGNTKLESRTGGTLVSILLVAYFICKPFYFFPSGQIQIADISVIVLFLASLLTYQKLEPSSRNIMYACVLFGGYVLVVNTLWAGILGDLGIVISAFFYLFNIAFVYVILRQYERMGQQILVILALGVVVSIACQGLVAVAFAGSGWGRDTLFFNNPNQLGYWAVLSVSVFSILMKDLRWNVLLQLCVFGIAFYLTSISLSKAASISFLVLVFIHFAKKPLYLALVIAAGTSAFFVFRDADFIVNLIERLSNIGQQSDDSVAGRGYSRIWEYPQYLLFGAGERGFQRFADVRFELHSTFGTILFSYGAIGSVLFCAILWQVYRQAGFHLFLYLVPVLLYGLTHQGLRSTLFWMVLAVISIVSTKNRYSVKEQNKPQMTRDPLPQHRHRSI